MKYFLPEGIVVEAEGNSGHIHSDLKQECPYCHNVECDWDCDLSQVTYSNADSVEREELEREHCGRLQYNAFIDGLESLILGLICAGVEVDDKFREGVQTALDAVANAD